MKTLIKSGSRQSKEIIQSYIMLLPMFIGLCIFVIYPLVWVMRYSVFRYDGYSQPIWVGIENFLVAFTNDPSFWESVGNTFIFAFGKLLVELPLALALAYFLNKKIRGRNLFRTIYFLPSVISVAIVGIVFFYLFNAYNGVVNGWLIQTGLVNARISWFSNKWTALLVAAIASIWQNFGINMIFFLTGLQSIPNEMYESCDLDGAGEWNKFYHITLPMLGPVLVVIVMNALLGSLKVTDLILVLTAGQPGGHSNVMMTHIYNQFFGTGASNYGYGSALVVIAAVILGITTFIYLRLTRKSQDIY